MYLSLYFDKNYVAKWLNVVNFRKWIDLGHVGLKYPEMGRSGPRWALKIRKGEVPDLLGRQMSGNELKNVKNLIFIYLWTKKIR